LRPPILNDFPEAFETGRLLIRSPMPGDGPELHAAVRESMDELLPWMPWTKEHGAVEDSEASAPGPGALPGENGAPDASLLKGTGTLVGSSGLHRIDWEVPKFEIGYWCRTRFSKQGYTTEAVHSIAAFAFEAPGAKRVEIRCDPLNRPSARVAERAGFRLEGELRNDALGTDGTPRNTLVYSAIPLGPDEPPA
jgi:RimJ/RimL family protein N-acetyltransferase